MKFYISAKVRRILCLPGGSEMLLKCIFVTNR